VIGAYAINGSMTDLYLILFFGVVGYVFDKVDIPVAPLVLSLVLGGMMEQSFRQAMTISGGNPQIFFNSTITVSLVVLSVISIATPFILARMKATKNATAAAAKAD
jgi:putative tricarboxylic transport membrane protein